VFVVQSLLEFQVNNLNLD
jgi:hypothetical protein